MEIWRDIEGYEGLYQVSNYGNIRSLAKWNGHKYIKRKEPYIMKLSNTTTGYKKIELSKDGIRHSYKVHRLVAKAFIPLVNEKEIINHKDGNPTNNNVNNLEWCTQQENVIHALKNGLRKKHTISEQELIKCINMGMKRREIIKKYHLSANYLYKLSKELGLPKLNNKYNIPKEELKELFKSKSNKEIAEIYNCTSTLIAQLRYQNKKGVVK